MPQLTFPIGQDGLALEMQVGEPASELEQKLAEGQPIPAPAKVRAILDTGADATSISSAVLTRLGRTALAEHEMVTASGTAKVSRYEISLSIFGQTGVSGPALVRSSWQVTNLLRPLPNIEGLIGLDLIRQLVLTVDGPGGTFSLKF